MTNITRKTCTKCGEIKPESEFYWKQRDVKRSSHCKECHKVLTHSYYMENRDHYTERNRERKQRNRESNRARIQKMQSETPCMDCDGLFHFAAMQFDHVRGTKKSAVSTLIAQGREPSVVDAEIKKCELVCANCHAVRTYNRL